MRVVPQRYEPEVPVGDIQMHPRNPHLGNPDAIARSIEANGFVGAVIVQESSGYILAGNHTWLGAKKKRAKTIPVLFVDIGDEHAERFMLAATRAEELGGGYDQGILDQLLADLEATEDGLIGTLWDDIPEDLDQVGVPATDRVSAERATSGGFDQVHALLSFPPEVLGDVQAAIAGLPEQVAARLSIGN